MIKHAIELFITYVFLPYSVILYFIFTGSILRQFIKEWLKERREKRVAKTKEAGLSASP